MYPGNYARTFLSILARILARILAVGILGILVILGVRILGILANCSQHSEEPFNGQYRPRYLKQLRWLYRTGLLPQSWMTSTTLDSETSSITLKILFSWNGKAELDAESHGLTEG